MKRTKIFSILLALTMSLSLLSGCGATVSPGSGGSSQPDAAGSSAVSASDSPAAYSIAALKGPTAMGLVKLMEDAKTGEGLSNEYAFTLAASADEITPKLIQGELDIACVPANLAAVLYQKTGGEIVTVAVNTLGGLCIMENGDEVHTMAQLKGKTIVVAGKGASPEYVLRYLLEENGLNPDTDVTIEWKSEHAECVAALAGGTNSIALLPQPFATVAQGKLPELRLALSLNEQWDALGNGSKLITGVTVARKSAIASNPAAMEAFLQDYQASVHWVAQNRADAAALIGENGIVDAAVAEKALPQCNIACITGAEMKTALSGYLSVLHDQAPQSVGGAMPDDDFYYGA